ncbi:TIGR01459 family HAD-type hydrolase [Bauldia sp.]|uniref:TIGR01459 family HAD-type hydrolase n=1 Tax=Bauldia sp. TaxID=2575872 RepID=UPI003BABF337
MTANRPPPRIRGLSEIVDDYTCILCDAWGVIHNGVMAHEPALDALRKCRAAGRHVVIVTNAPRPKEQVLAQFARHGVDDRTFDDIITSGGVARGFLVERPGLKVVHFGPDRDLPTYDGLDIEIVDAADAELVSCTGLPDDTTETPEDYADHYARWLDLGLPMVCANPDKVIKRGDSLVWCAGGVADAYRELGGETILLGKPHRPIFDTALARFSDLAGTGVSGNDVLVVGDSLETDLRGATDVGLDALFVTAGIHADRFGPHEDPDASKVAGALDEAGLSVRAFIPHLAW